MNITVIGTGYVGLVSGLCLASLGHRVICVDKDENKIAKLKQDIIPIFEPGLKELLLEVKKQQKISFSTDLKLALNDAQAVFIAVGTPQDEDGSADLSYVLACAKEIAQYSNSYKLVITKSTVPVGTGFMVAEIIKKNNPNLDFDIASNPEFLREGNALSDFMNPDRIVVGTNNDRAKKLLKEIYEKFPEEKIVTTDITTSELIKYASNSFLATKISFINEMADLCEKTGGNIGELSRAIGLDSRIGGKFLNVGPGFGGSCFPKDIMAILNVAAEKKVELSLISSVIKSNKIRQEKMVEKIANYFGGNVAGKKIAILGLAFKANTDDIRYSPAILIVKKLAQLKASLKVSDFEAIENSKKELSEFSNIEFFEDVYAATKDADLIVIATEWNEYKKLDFAKIKTLVKSPKILDLRNILDAKNLEALGFDYNYIGRRQH